MRISLVAVLYAAIAGTLALSFPAVAQAKTAKECQAEWRADKAANEAKKITEKAYVDKCKSEAGTEPMAKPAAATAPKDKPAKEDKTTKTSAPAGDTKKTAKACEEEWQANKAANQAKGITEKAYVETCRSGSTAAAPAAAPMAAPKEKVSAPAAAPASPAAPKEKVSTPM